MCTPLRVSGLAALASRRLGAVLIAGLGVLLAALVFSVAPALAAAPEVVSEFTAPAATASAEVRLEAAVNPNDESSECHFGYGEAHASEHVVACSEPGPVAEGGEQRAAVTVAGLKAGTTYHWRVLLKNASGKAEGVEEEITTVPAPHTEAPSPIGSTTATFKGTLTPLNKTVPTEDYFYYTPGEEFICLNERATTPMLAGTGSGVAHVSTAVTELEANQKYTVCLVSQNAFGSEEDPDPTPVHFTTLPAPPSVLGESASANSTEATLSAEVNANNEKTSYVFEYSTQESAGKLTGTITTLTGASELEGGSPQTAEAPTGAALSPGTTYYYRVVAENEQSKKEPHPAEGTLQSFTTVPAPSTDPVTAIGTTTATFNGHLTLNSVATSYSFDYKLGSECTGESSTSSTEATGASVSTPVTDLQPGRLYSACLVTSNTFGSQVGPPASFRALPETYVTEVGPTSATLHVVLEPEGAATTYSFQYGAGTSYGSETERASSVAGTKPISAEAHIQGLTAGSIYHFRVAGTVGHEAFESADATLSTQTEGSEFTLIDNRQWEMVSPPDKHGGSIDPIPEFNGLIQASEDGGAIAYISTDPIEAEPGGNRGGLEPSQVLARREPNGWSDEEITTPNNDVGKLRLSYAAEYKAFSSDLSRGIVEPPGETPLAAPALPDETQERTLWLRDDATRSYLAVVSAANVPAGTKIALTEAESVGISRLDQQPHFEGASPDLSHIVFRDFAPLVNGAGGENLYGWSGGKLSLVSMLPGNAGAGGGSSVALGGTGYVVRHAISNDGSRVIWKGERGEVYLRNMEREETIQIGQGEFQTASNDGSTVFFTDNGELFAFAETEASRDGGPLAGEVTNLTGEAGAGAGVQGEVIGASENGSYVYFVANGLLGDASERGANSGDCLEGMRGKTCILYVDHYDGSGWQAPQFIAVLSSDDFRDWNPTFSSLRNLTARVSPNGRWLAFMSDRRLTGYDNTDVSEREVEPGEGTKHADEEVYLYHFETSRSGQPESGKLVCASCNPTGQRPEGVFDRDPEEEQGTAPSTARRSGWLVGETLAGGQHPRMDPDRNRRG